jgi:putative transposase
MPRRLRLRLAGFPFHVIQRGNNRAPCFRRHGDCERYLEYLRESSLRHAVAVHAYVLMTNHVHLLMTPTTEDGVERAMKGIGQCYAQYFNRRYERTGTVWEGRFRSCLVDTEGYLLTCHRYIECNPVRAGLVRTPQDYPWSSHGANALGDPNPVVTPHSCVADLGASAAERQSAYRELFRDELTAGTVDEIRSCTNGGFALGSAAFRSEMAARLGRRMERTRSAPRSKRSASASGRGSDPEAGG